MILYLVTYNAHYGCAERQIEGITDNPDKWLSEHNMQRISDGNKPEGKEEFDFDVLPSYIYDKSQVIALIDKFHNDFCEGTGTFDLKDEWIKKNVK